MGMAWLLDLLSQYSSVRRGGKKKLKSKKAPMQLRQSQASQWPKLRYTHNNEQLIEKLSIYINKWLSYSHL